MIFWKKLKSKVILILGEAEIDSNVDLDEIIQSRKKKNINILKNKIKFISKMAKMQKILREENENIIKIKVKLI